MGIFVTSLIFLFIFICLLVICQVWWKKVICILLVIIDLYIGFWAIKNVIKYTSADGLYKITVSFRGDYLNIESKIRKNPSFENIQEIQKWNHDVREMYKDFDFWSLRTHIDWREITPIPLSQDKIYGLKDGTYILDDYKISPSINKNSNKN